MGMITKPNPGSLCLFLNDGCKEKGFPINLIVEVTDEALRVASGMSYNIPLDAERTKEEVGAPFIQTTTLCKSGILSPSKWLIQEA